MEEKSLNEMLSEEERKHLEKKITSAFQNQTETLSEELREILADDMVTAFQNRLITLIRIQNKHSD